MRHGDQRLTPSEPDSGAGTDRAPPAKDENSSTLGAALPLWDRLREAANVELTAGEEEAAQRDWQRWCAILGDASGQKLVQRLERSGSTPERARAALANALAAMPPVQWALLQEQVAAACRCEERLQASPCDPAAPIPFEDLLLPLLRVARGQLRARFAASDGLAPLGRVSDAAYLALERSLLVQLANIGGLALLQELDRALATPRRTLLKLLGSAPGEPPRDGYTAFVQKHIASGWSELFARYPVLLRLFSVALENWVNAGAEFLCRLHSDWTGLNLGTERVERLFPALSDPHHGQRAVIALELSSGRKLVYKPKDLALEAAFNDFLSWCNQRGLVPSFKLGEVHRRAGYGWCEYVAQQPCTDELAARRYYQRAGALLAVLYLLQATDCHRENLVAHGEHPVLVDMETLLYPTPRWLEHSSELEAATAELRSFLSSVIGCGLLPRWDVNSETGIAFDVSALGCVRAELTPAKVPQLVHVNSDDMLLRHEHVPEPLRSNVPLLRGAPLLPEQYGAELCAGFATLYRLLLRERAALVAPNGPLYAFKGLPARFLVRNTRAYHQLLSASFYPDALAAGNARSIGFERLAAETDGLVAANAWPILESELDALEQLDVPYFGRRTDGASLSIGRSKTIPEFFAQSGFDKVLALTARLDEADLAYQCTIIENSLLAARRAPSAEPRSAAPLAAPAALPREALLDEAVRLGDELLGRAQRRTDGGLSWLGLAYLSVSERYQLQPLGENLYEGKAGVALFLAALAVGSGSSRYAAGCYAALQLARGLWRDATLAKQMLAPGALGLGGVTGVASLAYALASCAALLDDASLLADAVGTLETIDADAIHRDRELDVMSGAAGALLCCLSVHHKTYNPRLLRIASVCGEHLLAQLRTTEAGLVVWSRPGKPALTGFSHGAAGIGLALAKLFRATGDARYLDAARAALAFERAHFSEKDRNWLDLRTNGAPGFMCAWCHGATGIGFSRLALADTLPDEDIEGELASAVHSTLAHPLGDVDHLCCGNFGRLELLATAAARRPDLEAPLAAGLARVIHAAREGAGYRLFHGFPRSAYNPGFFRGSAGVGYSLLRRVIPERLPQVLVLE